VTEKRTRAPRFFFVFTTCLLRPLRTGFVRSNVTPAAVMLPLSSLFVCRGCGGSVWLRSLNVIHRRVCGS